MATLCGVHQRMLAGATCELDATILIITVIIVMGGAVLKSVSVGMTSESSLAIWVRARMVKR